MINNRKRIIIISALGAAAVAAAAMCIMMTSRIRGGNPTGEALSQNINPIEAASQTEEPTVYVDNTVDIIDVNSKTRPFAVSVNNTPVAVQVQTGLNKAYIVSPKMGDDLKDSREDYLSQIYRQIFYLNGLLKKTDMDEIEDIFEREFQDYQNSNIGNDLIERVMAVIPENEDIILDIDLDYFKDIKVLESNLSNYRSCLLYTSPSPRDS